MGAALHMSHHALPAFGHFPHPLLRFSHHQLMQTSNINDNFRYIVKHYLPAQSTELTVTVDGSGTELIASHVSPSFLSLLSLTDVAVGLIPFSEGQAIRATLN